MITRIGFAFLCGAAFLVAIFAFVAADIITADFVAWLGAPDLAAFVTFPGLCGFALAAVVGFRISAEGH